MLGAFTIQSVAVMKHRELFRIGMKGVAWQNTA
jgi:hypothetical protein